MISAKWQDVTTSTATLAAQKAGERLGYYLREEQTRVVVSFVRGHDVFVSLPTGSGKSLCYSCLPYTSDYLRHSTSSLILVVSPLIALMKDQVATLGSKSLRTVYVCGSEMEECVVEELHQGLYKVVMFSPESLLTSELWRDMLLSDIYRENTVG